LSNFVENTDINLYCWLATCKNRTSVFQLLLSWQYTEQNLTSKFVKLVLTNL